MFIAVHGALAAVVALVARVILGVVPAAVRAPGTALVDPAPPDVTRPPAVVSKPPLQCSRI